MKFYQDKKSIEFKVGIFTIIALLILILGYSWFSEILESRKYTPVKVKFENAGNIEKGSSVSVLGVKKGRVKFLSIQKDGVILHLQVQLDFPLTKGTEFYIKEVDLMGEAQVEIIPGKSNEELDLEDVQNGYRNYGISTLISELSNMIVGMQNLLEEIVNEQGFIENVQSIIDTSYSFISKVNRSFDRNSDNIDKLIANTADLTLKFSELIDNNEENITETLASSALILSDLKITLAGINKTNKNFMEISEKILNEDGNFNRFITDKQLYDNLLKSTASLDSLLKDIKENPKRYFKIKIL
jgi:phospholipid/cholesterol/gamma-HCH transport system substrate-binding protein